MADEQNTELTLNTGTLLGIFFGLVVICGVFFSLGYAVGKNAGADNSAAMSDSALNSNVQTSGGAKPVASKNAPATEAASTPADSSTTSTPAEGKEEKKETPSTTPAKTESTPAASTQPGQGFMVQIAAVSKQEDADSLVAALRKKQYPVIVVPDPGGNLFRVQVGPFPQQKDAEAMKTKLAADGYNAIVKK